MFYHMMSTVLHWINNLVTHFLIISMRHLSMAILKLMNLLPLKVSFKGRWDHSHFIFEINVGKRRISSIFVRRKINWVWSNFKSEVVYKTFFKNVKTEIFENDLKMSPSIISTKCSSNTQERLIWMISRG